MALDFTRWDVYYGLAINGLFTGLGAAIGTYLANKHVIEGTKKLLGFKLKKKEDNQIKDITKDI